MSCVSSVTTNGLSAAELFYRDISQPAARACVGVLPLSYLLLLYPVEQVTVETYAQALFARCEPWLMHVMPQFAHDPNNSAVLDWGARISDQVKYANMGHRDTLCMQPPDELVMVLMRRLMTQFPGTPSNVASQMVWVMTTIWYLLAPHLPDYNPTLAKLLASVAEEVWTAMGKDPTTVTG